MHELSIGQLATASGLTVKRLRHYHDTGVLVAARVDNWSGQRRYLPGQVGDAVLVRRLRAAGIGLEEIAAIIGSATGREQLVTRALAAARAEMDRARSQVDEVALLLGAVPEIPFAVRQISDQHVLADEADLSVDECSAWFGETFGRLRQRPALITGPPGAAYAAEFFTEGRGRVQAFVSLGAATHGSTVLPGGAFAIAVHDGSYDSFETTYAALGLQVHRHCTPRLDADVREHYLIAISETPDPTRWRTEVCWPVTA